MLEKSTGNYLPCRGALLLEEGKAHYVHWNLEGRSRRTSFLQFQHGVAGETW